MDDRTCDCDLAIVGAGPTGLMMALQLGQAGLRVCLLEKRAEPFTTPRAIAYDAELMRSLRTVGVLDRIAASFVHDLGVRYLNAKGKVLGAFTRCPQAFGFASRGTYYQPDLERGLTEAIAELPNVILRRGTEVRSLAQDAGGVTLDLGGSTLRARYAVACDGGSSQIRAALGLRFEGETFTEKWVVVDTLEDRFPEDGIFFFCDPARPALTLPNAGGRRRWEFLVMPGDDEAEVSSEAWVRARIAERRGGTGFGIERCVIYTFHARYASQFRVGQVFLAGDAAHVTPPFAGQGLVGGVRDAGNLSWKLAGVLQGRFGEEILDSYYSERLPQLKKATGFAVRLGGFIMTTQPARARLRDGIMRLIWSLPPLRNHVDCNDPVPHNVLRHSPLVRRQAGRKVGRLIETPELSDGDAPVRLDALMGRGFALVGLGVDPGTRLGPKDRATLARLDARIVAIDAGGPLRDPDRALERWLGAGPAMLLVRPDRIIADQLLPGAGDGQLDWLAEAYSITPAAPLTLENAA
ncbi:bifunctional 3-(3-hydroxy-phenyl)propionate/3-hydroxycinnamic acid hydroxylase [Paenirhodobacter hankyongi]|uniref:Bifunctional 3-(3-hydroxy-phenyl)propionate/3-hydroxycinnamic acid hydroxylase n=1 Tax=Paenirhodobacter hankyongi TaxID=2294033 RepID=A0A421BQQ4_9RHOB|nr:bifunctional 3-(3-hydroxy-phenyl)propionate/3-hydroxycinnamic acid hydroxylase [Sinirhodobacter hankyongi]RLL65283.1 bifunctional 3-(3-hydroxy-phenyl)propionate/3-hydroxycinnamic acid hydroxylase [Sinirhodobacter hankyongi]